MTGHTGRASMSYPLNSAERALAHLLHAGKRHLGLTLVTTCNHTSVLLISPRA